MPRIREVLSREVLDSRGNPTVEVEIVTENHRARAIAPSGASTGVHEAHELRDKNKRYLGKGVTKAVANVQKMKSFLMGRSVLNQESLDELMIQHDGTKNKTKYGANAILAVSLAIARVAAKEEKEPLFHYLGHMAGTSMRMPTPFMNIINGGLHANNKLDFQEYMMVPKAKTFSEQLRIGSEVYHELKSMLDKKGFSTSVGDEGGFAPNIDDYKKPFDWILKAADNLGYSKNIQLAMDCAASDMYAKDRYRLSGKSISSTRLFSVYEDLISNYPIISIEDPFHEEDYMAFASFTKRFGKKINVVGDDLTVTNVNRMKKAFEVNACNTLLLKVNQIGTLTESIRAAKQAFKHDWQVMVSHRSGETEDTFIADLAVGLGCGMIKSGAPARGERTAKFNQLLRIEELFRNQKIY